MGNKDLILDISVFSDSEDREELFYLAKEAISNGGVVIIEQKGEGVPTMPIKKITNQSELDELRDHYINLDKEKNTINSSKQKDFSDSSKKSDWDKRK